MMYKSFDEKDGMMMINAKRTMNNTRTAFSMLKEK